MNTGLVNYYINKPRTLIPGEAVNVGKGQSKPNMINLLNSTFKEWTYEITGEEYVEQDTGYFVRLVLYAPGFVQSGVGRTYSDFNRNYKQCAINDALYEAVQGGLVDNSLVVNFDNRVNIENSQGDSESGQRTNPNQQVSSSQTVNRNRPSYSKEQIDKMTKFKNDYNIKTDVELMSYIQRWDPNIKKKNELTPYNIDDFLSWVDKLGGM